MKYTLAFLAADEDAEMSFLFLEDPLVGSWGVLLLLEFPSRHLIPFSLGQELMRLGQFSSSLGVERARGALPPPPRRYFAGLIPKALFGRLQFPYWVSRGPSQYRYWGSDKRRIFISIMSKLIELRVHFSQYKAPPGGDLTPSLPQPGQNNEVNSGRIFFGPASMNLDSESWVLKKEVPPEILTALNPR